jgi:hypothetical protein
MTEAAVLLQVCVGTPISLRWARWCISCRTAWSYRFHCEKRREKSLSSMTPAALIVDALAATPDREVRRPVPIDIENVFGQGHQC